MNDENDEERPLRVLHLEDSSCDAEIIRERLLDAGFFMQMDWAVNEPEFNAFLQHGGYDLILADYLLPGFDALAALALAKSFCPDVPFICVSGAIGEEKAVELLRQGATDYVLKGGLDKLPLSMQRALDEVKKQKALRLAAETLRKSEGRFRDLLASVTSYMYTVVMDCGQVISTTHGPGCLALTGFTPDDYAADSDLWHRMIHQDDRQAVLDAVQQVLTSQSVNTLEHRIQHQDGSIRWVQTTIVPHQVSPEGQLLSYDGVITDITARKRIEEVQIFLAQTTNRTTTEEPFFNAIARYLAQSLGLDFACIGRLDRDGLTARTLAVWCDGHFEANVTYALKDTPCSGVLGKEVCCFPAGVCQLFPQDRRLKDLRAESYVGVTLFDHTGQAIGLITVIGHQPLANQPMAEPILKLMSVRVAGELERQDAEESLRESEERFKSLYDNLAVGVVMINPDLRIIMVNPWMRNLFPGVDPTVNPICFSVFNTPPRNEPCPDCPVIKTFRDGSRHTAEREVSTCDKTHVITMNSSAIIDRERNVTAVIEIVDDITERKELEAQLRQAQKMEAIGTLAGGIAHDFNNILTPILGYSELVADIFPPDSKELGLVQEIMSAGKRAAELVKQILTFSRQTEQQQQPMQIHLITKEALKLLRASIPSSIAIKQNAVDCGLVMADPTQIHQVLMNLCTNAYHAMRETGGELSVSLSVVEITGQDYLENLALQPGPYVQLSVRDTGCGMSKKLQERIFEPYFTTKKLGEGTGLGLSMVHGIVQSHHGHITMHSEPGQGTEFHVYFPQIKVRDKGLVEDSRAVAIPRGSGTILVVDDEVPVGQLLREILLSLGYEVMLCSSSTLALETFQQNAARIDLVLTDMTMPVMSGVELIRRIKQLAPALPVVLCTGFSEIMDEEKAKQLGIVGYLFKPVSKRQLAQTIHEVLGKKETYSTKPMCSRRMGGGRRP